MTHVITQSCCNDGSCVPVCPVQCIRPRPGDPMFSSSEQLYIDAELCIDCGACLDVCPVNAIVMDFNLASDQTDYLEINAEFFRRHPIVEPNPPGELMQMEWREAAGLRVAIVGAGPAGCYAAEKLTDLAGVEVSMFDRLPTPHGLARAGVAPDHHHTRGIGQRFDEILSRPQVQCYLNLQIGEAVRIEDLLASHHAIIWAAGATSDRKLGIPGEDLIGSYSAREFVAWYNSHPDHATTLDDLPGDRAVVIGNGNVAMDIARILVRPVDELDRTDIAHHTIDALNASAIRQVTVAARRGTSEAAFTLPELLALTKLKGVSLLAKAEEVGEPPIEPGALRKYAVVKEAAGRRGGERQIQLRFLLTPLSINGATHVESVTFARNRLIPDGVGVRAEATGETETIPTSLVVRAVGYWGRPVPGLPFNSQSGTINNVGGRAVDPATSQPVAGLYCAGWIKRGATGVLGTNKRCSAETVEGLLEDFMAGRLAAPRLSKADFAALVAERVPEVLDYGGWARISQAEIAAGRARRRSSSRFVAIGDMLGAAVAGNG